MELSIPLSFQNSYLRSISRIVAHQAAPVPPRKTLFYLLLFAELYRKHLASDVLVSPPSGSHVRRVLSAYLHARGGVLEAARAQLPQPFRFQSIWILH
jgi:hypothetical protein